MNILRKNRLTPCESDHALIQSLENKNYAKNWVIFVLIVALILSHA